MLTQKYQSNIGRLKRKSKESLFEMILHEKESYFYEDLHNEWIPNLSLLLSNRDKSFILFMSSNITQLIVAHQTEFNIIPIVNSNVSFKIELYLVEKYLHGVKSIF